MNTKKYLVTLQASENAFTSAKNSVFKLFIKK